ncbi:MAG: HupE/UreJ family protein, partial [Candidatus Binatia bacterium]
TAVDDDAGDTCNAEPSGLLADEPGWAAWRWTFRCRQAPRSARLAWLATLPGHLHMVRRDGATHLVRGGDTGRVDLVGARPTAAEAVAEQFGHGLHHIAAGWDHLAFLVGLLLLAPGVASLAALVTGFTAGHGTALVLATVGGVLPPAATVEIAIAASVLVVGIPARPPAAAAATLAALLAAAAWTRPEDAAIWAGLFLLGGAHLRLRSAPGSRGFAAAGLVLAAVFGLLHGFGFAAAVIETARTSEALWPVLLGFNLGVEAGQLAFLLPAWLVLGRLRSQAWPVHVLRAAVCGMGAYWVAGRLLGAS